MEEVKLKLVPQSKSAALEEVPALQVSYVLQIQHLVNRILELLSKTSEADRTKIEGLKREYSESSKSAATLQKRIGDAAPWFAVYSSIFTLAQCAFQDKTIGHALTGILAQQAPNAVQSLYNGRLEAQKMEEQSRSNRASTELNLQQSKQSSESGQRQEAQELLRAALRTLEEASRA